MSQFKTAAELKELQQKIESLPMIVGGEHNSERLVLQFEKSDYAINTILPLTEAYEAAANAEIAILELKKQAEQERDQLKEQLAEQQKETQRAWGCDTQKTVALAMIEGRVAELNAQLEALRSAHFRLELRFNEQDSQLAIAREALERLKENDDEVVSAIAAEALYTNETQSPGSLHPVVRRGWRHFHCSECEHRWKWPSRDALSHSGENCPRCNEWCHPYHGKLDAKIPCDDMGNLTVPWNWNGEAPNTKKGNKE